MMGDAMVKTLVLVRHANPDYSADVPDLERPLTRAGLRSIQDTMPRELSLLDQRGSCSVWSSPALRARQTAEVVADVLHVPASAIEVHPELYAQDKDAFFANLAKARGCVVAVGHVPFMEELFALLSGGKVRVGKGSVACFTFEDEDLEHASLAWYVQGPDSERWHTLLVVGDTLSAQAQRIQDALKKLQKHPRDPELLHDFRVALRTGRSLMAFVRPFQKRRQNLAIDMLLSDLQHATSLLRELDVLCDRVKETGGSEALTLYAACQQARDNERTRVVAYLGRRDTQRKAREALHGMRNLRWRSGTESEGLGAREFCDEFDRLAKTCRKGYAACDFEDDDETHALRRRIKNLRYVAVGYAELLGSERSAVGGEAKKVQEELGVLCDARVNLRLIETFSKRGWFEGAEAGRDAFVGVEREREREALAKLQAKRGAAAARKAKRAK